MLQCLQCRTIIKKDNDREGVPSMSSSLSETPLSLSDVEKLQALYPDYRIELREGKLILMSPSDGISGAVGSRFSILLGTWVYKQNIGEVLDASTGFRLPNGDILSPN